MGHKTYFLRAADGTGPIKIGCSRLPHNRLRYYNSLSPVPLTILAMCEGGQETERRFHAAFAEDWSHHEWFHPTEALLRTVEQVASQTFDFSSLPPAKRIPQAHGWTAQSLFSARLQRALTRLNKAGVRLPDDQRWIANFYRVSPEERDRRRALLLEFITANGETLEGRAA